jgi:hypothetical protein
MSETAHNPELREAVYELHRYLSDEVAPMMVTDSVQILLRHPPLLMASEIQGWVGSQYGRKASDYGISDYLYHAVKKIHLLSEFELIEPAGLRRYLGEVGRLIINCCPEEDRERLQDHLRRLGETEATLTSGPVDKLYRQSGGAPGGSREMAAVESPDAKVADPDTEMHRGLRRLSLLIERLGKASAQPPASPAATGAADLQIQALATAAIQARNEADLQRYLQQLGGFGVDSRTDQVFRLLGQSLPAWELPALAAKRLEQASRFSSRSAEAMHKIVALAENPEESARRFNDLVAASIEQFNEGSLARAATMLDLAERIVQKKRVLPDVAQTIRMRSRDMLKADQLRGLAEDPENHSLLLRVMDFFPSLTVEGLLEELREERDRGRRKQLLMLLEVHGQETRAAALRDLESCMRGEINDDHGFHQRNMVYLMRRIAAPEEGPSDKELGLLRKLSALGNHWILVREAVRALGELDHPQAEKLLLQRLQEFEEEARQHGDEPSEDLISLLDYTTSALVSQGTPRTLRAVIEHAFRDEASLGNTTARLEDLGGKDLSARPELVEGLLQYLKDQLPKRILGMVLHKNADLPHVIRALSGTSSPAVREALQGVAERFAGQELGAEASRALENVDKVTKRKEQSSPSLSGDVELFGLPSLLQNLADSQVTGTLTLKDERKKTCGVVRFQSGKIRSCHYLNLEREEAIYQLFEKPGPCTFAFRGEPAVASGEGDSGSLIEVLPTMLEAVRRHDEYQQARTLVPDTVSFQKTETKPTRMADEEDVDFLRTVWKKATAGATPQQCEESVATDAYRVRRVLAHWVEAGALQMVDQAA